MTLAGKNVVVVGASRGVGRAMVRRMAAEGAQVLAVARDADSLEHVAKEAARTNILAMDATACTAPAMVFAALRPDVLIVCGGARPPGRPIQELTWEEFSVNWNTDVRMSFAFCREALRAPLAHGSIVILISSGAALGGSPISGGYAGAKRTQMFIANYAQKESDRLNLGVRFVALAPARIMPETDLGQFAAESYARYLGILPSEFIRGMVSRQTPQDVAAAAAELVSNGAAHRGIVFTISGDGIASVS
jgi:NAD(P)-dependent dehydrogenase (short-subunit alcohol dehydrogenase family)